jgi:transcriptional regulator with XRE-family HTH domain
MPHRSSQPRSRTSKSEIQQKDFALRLTAAMEERGLTVNETARRVREQLGDDAEFTTANISHYRQGRSIPRPRYLEALCRALGMRQSELLPGRGEGSAGGRANGKELVSGDSLPQSATLPAFDIKDHGGTAWIQINQQLPWPVAIKILQALKGENAIEAPE